MLQGGGKAKNMAAVGGGRNRRAIGDIENRITIPRVDGKPLQASRPGTSEGAAGAAKKVAQKKKVVFKPSPPSVIEISPDIEEVEREKKLMGKGKSAEEGPVRKKKPQSLTSTLTARSKAACGLANRPKEEIVDIDASDMNNELAIVEYVEDIYKFYKLGEKESRVQREDQLGEFMSHMGSQRKINEKMRAILIGWLIEQARRIILLHQPSKKC